MIATNKRSNMETSIYKTRVLDVYDSISQHFNETRVSHWKSVRDFLLSLPSYSTVLDIGCGNAKYSSVRPDIIYMGTDITLPLLHASRVSSIASLFQASCISSLPLRPHSVNAILHVAVLHHFPCKRQRIQIVKQFFTYLSPPPAGHVLITVWAYEQNPDGQNKRDTKWKRIEPNETDYLVPWRDKYTNIVHDRFYHLYTQEEANELIQEIEQTYPMYQGCLAYESNNWVIEFKAKCGSPTKT